MGNESATLRQLLVSLGAPLADLLAAPAGLEVEVNGVVILDPDDEPDSYTGDLVLIIGSRGRAAARLVRAAARRGAAVVAVKVPDSDATGDLRATANDAGVAVLAVRPEVRWDQLDSYARGAIADAKATSAADADDAGDLFSLAQTVAALTGGSVSIEDSANRVLAYSRSDDQVDELRRLSILGREGPASYLAKLREWGIIDRLREGDDVVHIGERPDLGIRRRLAIGIRADAELLGSIWVQEGDVPLTGQAEGALLGAARVAAMHLVRRRTGTAAGLRLQQDLLNSLFENRIDTATLAADIGIDAGKPAVVVVFAEQDTEPGRPARELRSAAITNLVSVHAAAYRRTALTTTIGSRVYLLLPDLPAENDGTLVLGLAKEIVAAARRRLQQDVRAAVGSIVERFGAIAESRQTADRVMNVMSGKASEVATMADVRAEVLVSETLALVEDNPYLRDPRVTGLIEYDLEHDAGLVRSVVTYFDALGDVRAAAQRLHIHPNTLRHRIKRAAAVSGLDFTDPHQRLFAHLQLLLAATGRGDPGDAPA
ncbi:PucR family transcriptional regulator [Amycolatopsis jejuensis]|uniref:PucR family transcriptional regulator n=1 Tax=Amycolatopsis jejuensis TaxID=330084 RepID=UPI0005247FC8|nr:helix-turn-helix domain-containing protein [Amycolatopsis jejuensis]